MALFRRLLLFVLSTVATFPSCATGVTWSERGALELLFWATDGRNWLHLWDIHDERSDPCLDNWFGIVCDRHGRVRAIRLANNHLVGFLPPEFGRASLSGLQELDLSSNYLTGSVPDSLSNFAALRSLRLDGNVFTGTVPSTLGSLQYLEFLSLQGNQFDPVDSATGAMLPAEVAQLGRIVGLRRCRISI